MDIFGCDYECRTVGESIRKYKIPDDWSAGFDAYDDVYPVVCISVKQIKKTPAMMKLKLRMVEDQDDEYAGCMVRLEKKSIVFKVEYMSDLQKAMEKCK